MPINSIESLRTQISGVLDEAEDYEVDRLETAELLEAFADAVRDGHTELEPDRGYWYQEAHGNGEKATDGGTTGGHQ